MDGAFRDLLANVAHALWFTPPDYARSLLGSPATWLGRHAPDRELELAQPRYLPGNLETAYRIALPSWPGRPAWIPPAVPTFGLFRESAVRPYPLEAEPRNPYPRESWLFLNGICTDERVLELNARCLHRLFGRPLTLLHNQTYGIALDLAECALGKGWLAATEAVRKLFPAFYSELKRPDLDRVVLIAHSQGTILAAIFLAMLRELLTGLPAVGSPESQRANALLRAAPAERRVRSARVLKAGGGAAGARFVSITTDYGTELTDSPEMGTGIDRVARWLDWSADAVLGLPRLDPGELRRLEIYCFATCATDMRELVRRDHTPYMEHFGNTRDLVARLGMFAPLQGPGRTRIDGLRFARPGAWGPLLAAHYLAPLERQWTGAADPGFIAEAADEGTQSRLRQAYLQEHPPEKSPRRPRSGTRTRPAPVTT